MMAKQIFLPSDGPTGTPSLRTLGTGALQAGAGNDSRFSDARTPTGHGSSHAPGGSDDTYAHYGIATASRIETMPRWALATAAAGSLSTAFYIYFTAINSLTISNLGVGVSSSGSSATLARLGLYTVNGSNDLTMVAETANDTTIPAGSGYVSRGLSTARGGGATFAMVRGTRYAFGYIHVGGTQAQIYGVNVAVGIMTLTPIPVLVNTGASDLATSQLASGLTNSSKYFYLAAT